MEQHGIEVLVFVKDLFKREEAVSLCQELEEKNIEFNILVNNAVQGLYNLFKDTDLKRELDIIDSNIASTIILSKHFLHKMLRRNELKMCKNLLFCPLPSQKGLEE